MVLHCDLIFLKDFIDVLFFRLVYFLAYFSTKHGHGMADVTHL
jgi:hypothetical protein